MIRVSSFYIILSLTILFGPKILFASPQSVPFDCENSYTQLNDSKSPAEKAIDVFNEFEKNKQNKLLLTQQLLAKHPELVAFYFDQWIKSLPIQLREVVDLAVERGYGEEMLTIYKNSNFQKLTEEEMPKYALPITLERKMLELRDRISRTYHAQVKLLPLTDSREIEERRSQELLDLVTDKNMKPATSQVISVLNQYPALARKIKQVSNELKDLSFQSPISKAGDLPGIKASTKADIEAADPSVQKAIVEVWNKLNNSSLFSRHISTLAEDAALEMSKAGDARSLNALAMGEITDVGVLRVLINRQKAKGETKFLSMTNSDSREFQNQAGQVPFFDKFFKGRQHSMTAHLLQREYVDDVIWKATNGKPELFWNYVSTSNNGDVWGNLFDSDLKSLSSPEDFSALTKKLMNIH